MENNSGKYGQEGNSMSDRDQQSLHNYSNSIRRQPTGKKQVSELVIRETQKVYSNFSNSEILQELEEQPNQQLLLMNQSQQVFGQKLSSAMIIENYSNQEDQQTEQLIPKRSFQYNNFPQQNQSESKQTQQIIVKQRTNNSHLNQIDNEDEHEQLEKHRQRHTQSVMERDQKQIKLQQNNNILRVSRADQKHQTVYNNDFPHINKLSDADHHYQTERTQNNFQQHSQKILEQSSYNDMLQDEILQTHLVTIEKQSQITIEEPVIQSTKKESIVKKEDITTKSQNIKNFEFLAEEFIEQLKQDILEKLKVSNGIENEQVEDKKEIQRENEEQEDDQEEFKDDNQTIMIERASQSDNDLPSSNQQLQDEKETIQKSEDQNFIKGLKVQEECIDSYVDDMNMDALEQTNQDPLSKSRKQSEEFHKLQLPSKKQSSSMQINQSMNGDTKLEEKGQTQQIKINQILQESDQQRTIHQHSHSGVDVPSNFVEPLFRQNNDQVSSLQIQEQNYSSDGKNPLQPEQSQQRQNSLIYEQDQNVSEDDEENKKGGHVSGYNYRTQNQQRNHNQDVGSQNQVEEEVGGIGLSSSIINIHEQEESSYQLLNSQQERLEQLHQNNMMTQVSFNPESQRNITVGGQTMNRFGVNQFEQNEQQQQIQNQYFEYQNQHKIISDNESSTERMKAQNKYLTSKYAKNVSQPQKIEASYYQLEEEQKEKPASSANKLPNKHKFDLKLNKLNMSAISIQDKRSQAKREVLKMVRENNYLETKKKIMENAIKTRQKDVKIRTLSKKLEKYKNKIEQQHLQQNDRAKNESQLYSQESSALILDDSFDLQQFLKKQRLKNTMEGYNKLNYSTMQTQQNQAVLDQYSQMQWHNNNGNQVGITTFHKHMFPSKNRPMMEQNDDFYKQLYLRAKNKRIADYFQQQENDQQQLEHTPQIKIPKLDFNQKLNIQFNNSIKNHSQSPHRQHSKKQNFEYINNSNHNISNASPQQILPPPSPFQAQLRSIQSHQQTIINVDQTYNIVQHIKNAYGINLNDKNEQIVDGKQKWTSVLKFMENNPKLLMQFIPSDFDNQQLMRKQQRKNNDNNGREGDAMFFETRKPKPSYDIRQKLDQIFSVEPKIIAQPTFPQKQSTLHNINQNNYGKSLVENDYSSTVQVPRVPLIKQQFPNQNNLSHIEQQNLFKEKNQGKKAASQKVGSLQYTSEEEINHNDYKQISERDKANYQQYSQQNQQIQQQNWINLNNIRDSEYNQDINMQIEYPPPSYSFSQHAVLNQNQNNSRQQLINQQQQSQYSSKERLKSQLQQLMQQKELIKNESLQAKQEYGQLKFEKEKLEEQLQVLKVQDMVDSAKKLIQESEKKLALKKQKIEDEKKSIAELQIKLSEEKLKKRNSQKKITSNTNEQIITKSKSKEEGELERSLHQKDSLKQIQHQLNKDNSQLTVHSQQQIQTQSQHQLDQINNGGSSSQTLQFQRQTLSENQQQENTEQIQSRKTLKDEESLNNNNLQINKAGDQYKDEQKHNLQVPQSNAGSIKLSPAISLQTLSEVQPSPLFDWNNTRLKAQFMQDNLNFNSENDENFYTEQEIEELFLKLKQNYKDYQKVSDLQPIQEKIIRTMKELMSLLNLENLQEKIFQTYQQIELQNTYKLLVRVNLLLKARSLLIETFKDFNRHEDSCKLIKRLVESHLEQSIDEQSKEEIRQNCLELMYLTNKIRDDIIKLRDEYKVFGKNIAVTKVNGDQQKFVKNIMIYKRRDALKGILQDYDDIRKLVQVFDVKELQYISYPS